MRISWTCIEFGQQCPPLGVFQLLGQGSPLSVPIPSFPWAFEPPSRQEGPGPQQPGAACASERTQTHCATPFILPSSPASVSTKSLFTKLRIRSVWTRRSGRPGSLTERSWPCTLPLTEATRMPCGTFWNTVILRDGGVCSQAGTPAGREDRVLVFQGLLQWRPGAKLCPPPITVPWATGEPLSVGVLGHAE